MIIHWLFGGFPLIFTQIQMLVGETLSCAGPSIKKTLYLFILGWSLFSMGWQCMVPGWRLMTWTINWGIKILYKLYRSKKWSKWCFWYYPMRIQWLPTKASIIHIPIHTYLVPVKWLVTRMVFGRDMGHMTWATYLKTKNSTPPVFQFLFTPHLWLGLSPYFVELHCYTPAFQLCFSMVGLPPSFLIILNSIKQFNKSP